MRITEIKYISELWDTTRAPFSTAFDIPRESEQPLPEVQDILHFGSAQKWVVTKTEQHENILWVWVGKS